MSRTNVKSYLNVLYSITANSLAASLTYKMNTVSGNLKEKNVNESIFD